MGIAVAGGLPTVTQREMAALLYAGPGSMITGSAALFTHGVRVAHTELVDVLVRAAEVDSRGWHLSPRDWERTWPGTPG